jgi:hypothetical protein
MNLPTNIELDSGDYAVIDTQFDTRFIMNYILYHTSAHAQEMNFKGHPYVTPISYAGYCLTLFYAHLLACDATFRPEKSFPAARFLSDSDRKDLFNKLLSSHVPVFLSDLLMEIAPVYDARRNNMLLIPSLAGYLHLHDFGRTIPPNLFYVAHHMLASTRTNAEPDDVLNALYQKPILSYGTRTFTIANYFGTLFGIGHHENFVNRDFNAFFNPLVGRFLTQRPTFARINLSTPDLADDFSGNIYSVLLLASDENLSLSSTLYDALSTFVLSDEPNSPKLGSIVSALSGTLLTSHTNEPPTHPTWTGVKTKDGKKD